MTVDGCCADSPAAFNIIWLALRDLSLVISVADLFSPSAVRLRITFRAAPRPLVMSWLASDSMKARISGRARFLVIVVLCTPTWAAISSCVILPCNVHFVATAICFGFMIILYIVRRRFVKRLFSLTG